MKVHFLALLPLTVYPRDGILLTVREWFPNGTAEQTATSEKGFKMARTKKTKTETTKVWSLEDLSPTSTKEEKLLIQATVPANGKGQRFNLCKTLGCTKGFYGNTVSTYCAPCWKKLQLEKAAAKQQEVQEGLDQEKKVRDLLQAKKK